MEIETLKLINVLRRIARAAGYAAWVKADPDAVRFCATQYNRVLARLGQLEPTIQSLFTPLPEDASPEVTRLATRELLAYFEDELPDLDPWRRFRGCGPRRLSVRGLPLAVRCE